jgi:ferredoxin-NADP reductase
MQALIKEKRQVAKGTLLVTFDLLGEEVDFTPGQYFFVTLPDVGYQDEKGLRRHITVVTSPNEKGVLGFATRMRESAFKRSLDELPVGAEVEVEQPKGKFALPEDPARPLVFVAGGIGITVFRSMLRYIREEKLPYRVTLIFTNRDRESAAFLDGRTRTFGSSSR